jgi:hypothetical protein
VTVLRARERGFLEPRKRSALGQAKGAQAEPELNVAKPHLFRERSDQGLYGVWGEVLPKVLYDRHISKHKHKPRARYIYF